MALTTQRGSCTQKVPGALDSAQDEQESRPDEGLDQLDDSSGDRREVLERERTPLPRNRTKLLHPLPPPLTLPLKSLSSPPPRKCARISVRGRSHGS